MAPGAERVKGDGRGDDGQDVLERIAARARFGVMIMLIERLTGRRVQLLDPAELQGRDGAGDGAATAAPASAPDAAVTPQRQGWGIDVTMTETRTESQYTAFSAAGRVTTADGREITFAVDLELRRESVDVTGFRLRAGDALIDPLVLNFGAGPTAMTPSAIDFDLNADGVKERISFVSGGNGFLALDRNGNGIVDDGRELFGPATGDGFAELAAYDGDGNGWIDEGDAIYSQLRIWDDAGGELKTLKERGVGAIALDRVGTPFDLGTGDGSAGELRSTGIWLGENGSVGTIHHIDLAI